MGGSFVGREEDGIEGYHFVHRDGIVIGRVQRQGGWRRDWESWRRKVEITGGVL